MNKVRPQLSDIRSLYVEAENSSSKAATGLNLIERVSEKNVVTLAYKGAFEALQAKFSWNAYYQFSQVNKAMKFLERAVEQDPENAEVRYLRFSVNYFLPSFLQKTEALQNDKEKLLALFPFEKEVSFVQEQIIRFLNERVKLKPEEKARIQVPNS